MTHTLSKSRYLSGLQCPQLLWNEIHARGAIPEPGPDQQWIFDQGHEIGALAQRLAPGGTEVPHGPKEQTIAQTAALLPRRLPIYEASFLHDGAYCRVDILRPVAGDAWDVLEVKSSTSVADVNLHDVAFQVDCLRRSGLDVRGAYLVHVDNSYVRQGAVDPTKLLTIEDVTQDIEDHLAQVPARLARMQEVLDGSEPEFPIGTHCKSPYPCPLKSRCWAQLAPDAPTTFHRAGKKSFEWLAQGYERTVDVPLGELSEKQRVQREADRRGEVQVRTAALSSWLQAIDYPLLHLDFEAFATAVPRLDGTGPYQPVPFQASVHIMHAPGGEAEHWEFLWTERSDPRPGMIEFLESLPREGSVAAWHASYERKILDGLRAHRPSEALDSLLDRLIDLEDPFRAFDVYHPAQRGRTSIKAVLPAFGGAPYEAGITGGMEAAREYVRVVWNDVDAPDRAAVLRDLSAYCEKDTRAMVDVLRAVEGLVAS